MQIKISLAFLAALIFCPFIKAQNTYRWCSAHEISHDALLAHPHLQTAVDALEEFTLQWIADEAESFNAQRNTRIIPVVVHIIHNYGPENISRAQVLDAIRILNEDFSAANADLGLIIPEFQGIIGNPAIEFRLAQKDPQGNCTEGITRTVSNLTFSAGDNVKQLISWPRSRYFNIWVVQNIASGAGGYAYLPGTAPSAAFDGVVVRNSQFGSIGTSSPSNFAARTLTHEAGHWLNLRHTWGPTNNPGLTTNCNSDDGVSDTPNTIGVVNQNCVLTTVTCGSLDNIQNYMDYSSCARMFTVGQANRMNAALSSTVGQRSSLWTATNLSQTGTQNGFVNVCAPKADFRVNAPTACTGANVQFIDLSYNAEVDSTWSWFWTFEGGNPATSTLQNPVVIYNQSGAYNVSLTVSSSAGSSTLTRSQFIQILPSQGAWAAPLFEGFEANTFPVDEQNPAKAWTFAGEGASGWESTFDAAYTGIRSLVFEPPSGAAPGITTQLIAPALDLTQTDNYNFKFRMAYQPRNNRTDRLIVSVSQDCGITWSPRFNRAGSTLVTAPGTSLQFVPMDATQWREINLSLNTFSNVSNLLVRFEFQDSSLARLYIDDINISNFDVGINRSEILEGSVLLMPNPAQESSALAFELTEPSPVSYEVIDLFGRVVAQKSMGILAPGSYQEEINIKGWAKGVYMVHMRTRLSNHTVKLKVL